MRPKLISLLAVSTVALVGCANAEPSSEPTATVTVTATPSEESTQASAAPITDEVEEAYLVEYKQMAGNVKLYSEEELVEIGYDACELMQNGKKVPHNFTGDTQGDHSVGIPAGMAAKAKLCPEVTE